MEADITLTRMRSEAVVFLLLGQDNAIEADIITWKRNIYFRHCLGKGELDILIVIVVH